MKNDSAIVKSSPNNSITFKHVQTGINDSFKTLAKLVESAKTPGALAAVYTYVSKDLDKLVKSYREVINTRLKSLVEEAGEPDDKNPNAKVAVSEYAGSKYSMKVTPSFHSEPDRVAMEALLTTKKINFNTVYKQVVSTEYDKDAVARLISEGKLTEEEVQVCRRVKSQALTVEKL